MVSTSDGIGENTTKKRRARPDFAERKVRQKQSVYTTVKTGWRKFCKDKQMVEKIDEAVQVCSRIACEASMLVSVHVLRLLEAGEELPPLDNNFFNRCSSAIANLAGNREVTNPELEKGENMKHEVIHWSKSHFYRECGYHRQTKLTKEWIDAEPNIKTFNENVPLAKVANLVSYLKRVRFCLVYLDCLLAFYLSKKMKRLRWSTYIHRQQTYEKVVKSLTGGGK